MILPPLSFPQESMTRLETGRGFSLLLKVIFRALATHTQKNSVTEFFINPHTFLRKFLAIPFGDCVPAEIVGERERIVARENFWEECVKSNLPPRYPVFVIKMYNFISSKQWIMC
ncbi:hypothetical protein CEXT_104211 [Caerostris extrusa]|uniref:Uncharacterized protein n=1 Tax=Caerostris extrusa TaxID=172846 RepID=A0AAV4R439_CAEEX|nr:hypothetical protein CEXT_104211 [Caerostris extrusa]